MFEPDSPQRPVQFRRLIRNLSRKGLDSMGNRRLTRATCLLLFLGLDLFPCAAFAQAGFDHLWSHDTGG